MSNNENTILILDDEEVILEVTKKILKFLKFNVETALSGEEAIIKYKNSIESGNTFNIVIIDLTLPTGISGKETFERLKEIDPNVKAIVSSGFSDDPIIKNYQEFGFSGVLMKPYNIEQLKKTLENLK